MSASYLTIDAIARLKSKARAARKDAVTDYQRRMAEAMTEYVAWLERERAGVYAKGGARTRRDGTRRHTGHAGGRKAA